MVSVSWLYCAYGEDALGRWYKPEQGLGQIVQTRASRAFAGFQADDGKGRCRNTGTDDVTICTKNVTADDR